MGIRPHFEVICGIHDFPVDSDGHPVKQSAFTGYPCYVPQYDYPLYERLEEQVVVPSLPNHTEMAHIIHTAEKYERDYWLDRHALCNRLVDKNGDPKMLDEVFHYSSGEYGVAGLYGYRVGPSLGIGFDDMRYALVSLDPKYESSGFIELPSLTLEECQFNPVGRALQHLLFVKQNFPERFTRDVYRSLALRELNEMKQDIRNGQYYPFFRDDFELYARTACYVFRQLGFFIRKRALRLMLVWEWT